MVENLCGASEPELNFQEYHTLWKYVIFPKVYFFER